MTGQPAGDVADNGTAVASTQPVSELRMPFKQKMATSLKSFLQGARKLAVGDDTAPGDAHKATIGQLFPKVNPEVDGEDCDQDCNGCVTHLPKSFKIDEEDQLYGWVKGWSTHLIVATGKTDWVRDVADEKGSVMQAVEAAPKPNNGRLMLSASNMPTPNHSSDYSEPTTVLLLPAFTIIDNVTPATVPTVITSFIEKAPTNSSPLAPLNLPQSVSAPLPDAAPAPVKELQSRPCPHAAVILLCSQKTRDARCGQSAPLIRKELERVLRPIGLYRDLDDERPGGVGIYFISHVGGHKYSANMMVYRRPDAFGLDNVERAKLAPGEEAKPNPRILSPDPDENGDVGAAQCIWLARVRPEDCEGIVRFTVLQGKVIKPERQLRGGFDRSKGLLSW